MGHHYVPQRYLKNFQARGRPGFIWLYDKQPGKPRLAAIAQVAQSKEFYSPETEDVLAREVERPANAVIAKLINNDALSSAERFELTFYIGTMLKRVPFRRRKAMEMYPKVLDDTVARVRRQIIELAGTLSDVDPELVARRLHEVDAARAKFEHTPPTEIVEQVREPWPSEAMLDAIYRMTWRVLISRGPTYFITTDNPAFFFGGYGLGTPEAELTFPLSTTHALHGCSQRAESYLVFLSAPEQFVREVNRRLASAAERLAFYHEPTSWLEVTLRKESLYLSAIRW
jgi:uncharacterized protein DUF4238